MMTADLPNFGLCDWKSASQVLTVLPPPPLTSQTRTTAHIEFQVIGTRGNWANDYGHAAITVDVG